MPALIRPKQNCLANLQPTIVTYHSYITMATQCSYNMSATDFTICTQLLQDGAKHIDVMKLLQVKQSDIMKLL